MATEIRHTVQLDQVDAGLAFLKITIEGALDGPAGTKVADQVLSRVDALEGRPFGLLFDLRKITDCDEAGANAMQRIEMTAASKGLEKVAHLVAQKELVAQANAALQASEKKLISTFDDEASARRFASGLA